MLAKQRRHQVRRQGACKTDLGRTLLDVDRDGGADSTKRVRRDSMLKGRAAEAEDWDSFFLKTDEDLNGGSTPGRGRPPLEFRARQLDLRPGVIQRKQKTKEGRRKGE